MDMNMKPTHLQLGFLIFEDMELLDFAGPYEVFQASNEVAEDDFFQLSICGVDGLSAKTYRGPEINATHGLYPSRMAEVWIIPGGQGSRQLASQEDLLRWLKEQFEQGSKLVSICSGARVLAAAGLLDTESYTTHPLVVEELMDRLPFGNYVADQPFVPARNERIWTTGAVAKGIDWAIHFTSSYRSAEHIQNLKKYLGLSY